MDKNELKITRVRTRPVIGQKSKLFMGKIP